MTNKIYINWDEFHQSVKNLCTKIKTMGEFEKIIAVSRGGLIPAGIIAYELNIRNTEVVNISSYDNNYDRRDDKDIELNINVDKADEKTLIVDDLADTGRTFQILRQFYPQAKFVSVYAKDAGQNEVDVFAKRMPDDWIVFPWD